MKTRAFLYPIALIMTIIAIFCSNIKSFAATDNVGFAAMLGYQGYDLRGSGLKFDHGTHTGDQFLGTGSAGTTSLENKILNMAVLGIRYQNFIAPKVSYDIGFGGLIGGVQNRMQNINDHRPAANGAFVVSKSNFGFTGVVGANYHFSDTGTGLYLGGSAQVSGLFVTHGWDRFGTYEAESSSIKWIPSIGPRIGFEFNSKFIEVSGQLGQSPSIQLVIGIFL